MRKRAKYTPRTGGSYEHATPVAQQQLSSLLESEFGAKLTAHPAHAWKYGLSYVIEASEAKEIFRTLRDDQRFDMKMLVDVTAIDWLDRREPRFDVVYHLMSLTQQHRLCLRIQVGEDTPEVDSVRSLWPAANFLEREVWDLFGIVFRDHGDLRRILMYDEFVGHPLRKDYPKTGKQPRVPLRIPELRNTSQDMRKDELVSLPTPRRRSPESV